MERCSTDELLVMDLLPAASYFDEGAESHAAILLADLHSIEAPACGFEMDCLAGSHHAEKRVILYGAVQNLGSRKAESLLNDWRNRL